MEVRLILGDQLNPDHSWFSQASPHVCFVMYEMRQETDYAPHHIQKVVAFFGAMRRFAKYLESKGHTVLYYTLDDAENEQQLDKNLRKTLKLIKATSFVSTAWHASMIRDGFTETFAITPVGCQQFVGKMNIGQRGPVTPSLACQGGAW